MSQNSKALDGLSLASIQAGRHLRGDVITEPDGYMAAPTLRPPPPSTPNPNVSYSSTQISVAAGTAYTVASGQDIAIENIPLSAPRGYVNLLTEYGLTTNLTNEGHIFARSSNLSPAFAINANGYGLVSIVNNGSIYSNGVTNHFETSSGTSAYGLYLTTVANVTNNGLIQVVSLDRLAIGCLGASHFHNTETAILRVDAYGSARGITLGNVINEGVIEVFGGDSDYASGGAVGLLEVSSLNNSGTIRVVAYSDFYISAAIMVHENLAVEYNNSGTIIGQYAFYDAYIRDFIPDRHSKFTNSGIIVGDMVFGKDSYTVINTGSIDGDLFFGDPHFVGYDHLMNTNTYDGRGGVISGGIFLGKGNGVLWLGDSGESVYNGGGKDTIVGGLGDDLVDIIGGTVSANGGAGFDILSFASAGTGLTLNIQLGTANGVAAVNFTHFEAYVTTEYADTVTGSSGDDLVVLGAGNDTVFASTGIDDIRGDAGDDTLIVGVFGKGSALSTFDGGAGTDTFDASTATGDLTFLATQTSFEVENYLVSSAERIIGGSGNDTFDFYASESAVTLIGGLGNDTINGGAGTDTAVFSGNLGSYSFSSGPNGSLIVTGADGTDTLTSIERVRFDDGTYVLATGHRYFEGGAGADTVTGTNGRDELRGLDGDDILNGLDGDDYLIGGAGSDTIDGGAGADMAIFSGSITNYTITSVAGGVSVAGANGTDIVNNVERFRFDDGIFILASGYQYVEGSNNAETILGSFRSDEIHALGGDDIINAGDADDTIIGGLGNDTIDGGAGTDLAVFSGGLGSYSFSSGPNGNLIVSGADGSDTLINVERVQFSDGIYVLATGHRYFEGGGGADTVIGTNGRDELQGLGGDDILNGLDGDDYLTGGAGSDTIDGGAGADMAIFSGSITNYTITSVAGGVSVAGVNGTDIVRNVERFQFDDGIFILASGYQYVEGSNNAETILGSFRSDEIHALGGDDIINAGDADDTIIGGLGNDTIDGGTGIDLAVFSGLRSAYTITQSGGQTLVVGADGSDTLINVERLQFSDGIYDITGNPLAAPAFETQPLRADDAKTDSGPQVLPGAVDEVLAKDGDEGPQVLPGASDVLADKGGGTLPLVWPGALDDDFLPLKPDTDSVGPQIQPGAAFDFDHLDTARLEGGRMDGLGLHRFEHDIHLFDHAVVDTDPWA